MNPLQGEPVRYGFTFDDLPEDVSDGAIGATISVTNGTVQTISTEVYYPLNEMLQIYRQPDEVWVSVDESSIDPEAPFKIALFYCRKGILAFYAGKAKKEPIIDICPERIIGPTTVWYLWNPALELSFEEAGSKILLFAYRADNDFSRIETVTNLDAAKFYDTYQHAENATKCFRLSTN